MRGESIAQIFEQLAKQVTLFGAAGSTITLDYQLPSDVVQEGDLVPVIVLSLRPATLPTGA